MNVDLVTIFFLPPKGETSATYPNHCLISTFHRFHLPDLHHHHHHQHIIINIFSSCTNSTTTHLICRGKEMNERSGCCVREGFK